MSHNAAKAPISACEKCRHKEEALSLLQELLHRPLTVQPSAHARRAGTGNELFSCCRICFTEDCCRRGSTDHSRGIREPQFSHQRMREEQALGVRALFVAGYASQISCCRRCFTDRSCGIRERGRRYLCLCRDYLGRLLWGLSSTGGTAGGTFTCQGKNPTWLCRAASPAPIIIHINT